MLLRAFLRSMPTQYLRFLSASLWVGYSIDIYPKLATIKCRRTRQLSRLVPNTPCLRSLIPTPITGVGLGRSKCPRYQHTSKYSRSQASHTSKETATFKFPDSSPPCNPHLQAFFLDGRLRIPPNLTESVGAPSVFFFFFLCVCVCVCVLFFFFSRHAWACQMWAFQTKICSGELG